MEASHYGLHYAMKTEAARHNKLLKTLRKLVFQIYSFQILWMQNMSVTAIFFNIFLLFVRKKARSVAWPPLWLNKQAIRFQKQFCLKIQLQTAA